MVLADGELADFLEAQGSLLGLTRNSVLVLHHSQPWPLTAHVAPSSAINF